MQRNLIQAARWAVVALLVQSSSVLLAQTWAPQRDPINIAASKAEREGRLADAEKILTEAVRNFKQDESNGAQLSLYLKRLASLLERRNEFSEAIALSERALAIDREIFGPESSRVAAGLSNLAAIYRALNKDEVAEQLYIQALDIARRNPKPDARTTVLVLNNLAALYSRGKRWAEAEPLLLEGTKLCESMSEPQTSLCSALRGWLGEVYRKQGKEDLAEQLSADTLRKSDGPDRAPMEAARGLHAKAQKYESEKNFSEAERHYRQAIALYEKNEEPDGPLFLLMDLQRLGRVLDQQGQKTEAEQFYLRALEMEISIAGKKHPDLPTASGAFGLLNLYRAQGRLREMEPIFGRILETQERLLGPRHANVAFTMVMLAQVYSEQQKHFEARPLFERALAIQEKNFGTDHPQLIGVLSYYAALLRQTKEAELAAGIEARIEAIRKKLPSQRQPN